MFATLAKIFYIIGDRRRDFLIAVALFFLVTLLDLVGIGLLQPFVALVSQQSETTSDFFINQFNRFGIESRTQIILIYGLGLILIFGVQFFLYFFSLWQITHFVSNGRAFLVKRLMHAYLFAPYTFHLNHNSATIITHVINETHSYSIFLNSLLKIVTSTLVLAGMFGLLFFTDAKLLVLISIVIFPPVIFSIYFGQRVKQWGKMIVLSTQKIVKLINHSMGGFKDTRILGAEHYFDHHISQEAFRLARYTTIVTLWREFPAGSIRFSLIVLIVIVALITTFVPGTSQGSDAGILAVFAVASLRIIPSANYIISSYSTMKQSSYSVEAVYEDIREITDILNTPGQETITRSDQPLLVLNNTITLQDLTYRYPATDQDALRGINLQIKKGESIAFIGRSGAGKTTLVDVILGLLTPTAGDILVDNQSIYHHIRRWQNTIGYIPQSIFLTDESLRQNIAFGVPLEHIDEYRLQKAITAAQLQELVDQLPDGLDTLVGERGVRLSGGQRQRVGIARALYHERDILVLDEATSALDSETEKLVTAAISALSGTKTLLIIAHRLSTVKDCDRLYLMDQGQIIKVGTFEEVVVSQEGTDYQDGAPTEL